MLLVSFETYSEFSQYASNESKRIVSRRGQILMDFWSFFIEKGWGMRGWFLYWYLEKERGRGGDNRMGFIEKFRELVLNQDGRDERMGQDLGFEPGCKG